MKLDKALRQSPEYLALPSTQQELFKHMSVLFSARQEYLTLNHYELAAKVPSTNPDIWQDFLSLTAVEHWIKNQLSFNANIAFRKAQKSLINAAEQGNVSAAKSVTEISGLFDHEKAQRQVVLCYVPRPTYTNMEVPTNDQEEELQRGIREIPVFANGDQAPSGTESRESGSGEETGTQAAEDAGS